MVESILAINHITHTLRNRLHDGHATIEISNIALSYALLGAFAMGVSQSGVPNCVAQKIIDLVQRSQSRHSLVRLSLISAMVLMAVASQNLIPVHIAFIPVLIPPLLGLLNNIQMDRRLIACCLTFGLTSTYMLLPVGFGNIFLIEILAKNLHDNGLDINSALMPLAMIIPVSGMLIGLLVAIVFSYRKPRIYRETSPLDMVTSDTTISKGKLLGTVLAMVLTLVAQLLSNSMIVGAAAGCMTLVLTGVIHWRESNDVFVQGMKMMAYSGFIMIAAAGFAEVMRESGAVTTLVASVSGLIVDNQAIAVLLMLFVGLLITMGIGSSFSTIPVIAALYVPLGLEMGLSPLAIAALVGTAGALGDAGSPASDSTIGPTAGLNADNQHDHIRGTVIPTFIHFNIPLIVFGWLAVMVL